MHRPLIFVISMSLLLSACQSITPVSEKRVYPQHSNLSSDSAISKSAITYEGFFYNPQLPSSLLESNQQSCEESIAVSGHFPSFYRCMMSKGYRYYELPQSVSQESKIRLSIRQSIAKYIEKVDQLNQQMMSALENKTCLRGEETTPTMLRIKGDISSTELKTLMFYINKDIENQEALLEVIGPWLTDSDFMRLQIDRRKSMLSSLQNSQRPISWTLYNFYNHRHAAYDDWIEQIKSQKLKF